MGRCAWCTSGEPRRTVLRHGHLKTTQLYAESSTEMMRESDPRALSQ
jgi:hypothetical protein